MAGLTLAVAEAKLATWLEADDKLANGAKQYMVDGIQVTRESCMENIEKWDRICKRLARGGGVRSRRIIPMG